MQPEVTHTKINRFKEIAAQLKNGESIDAQDVGARADIKKTTTFLEESGWARAWEAARSSGSFEGLLPKVWKVIPKFYPACLSLTGTRNNFALFCVLANRLIGIKEPTAAEIEAIHEKSTTTRGSLTSQTKTKWGPEEAEDLIKGSLLPLIEEARRTGDWYPLRAIQLVKDLNIQRICRALYGDKNRIMSLLKDKARSGLTDKEIEKIEKAPRPALAIPRSELVERVHLALSLSRRTGDYRFLMVGNVIPGNRYQTILTEHKGYDEYLKVNGVKDDEIVKKNRFSHIERAHGILEQVAQRNTETLACAVAMQHDIGIHALLAMSKLDPIWIVKIAAPRHRINAKSFDDLVEFFAVTHSGSRVRIGFSGQFIADAAVHLTALAQSRAMLARGAKDGIFPELKLELSDDATQVDLHNGWREYAEKFVSAVQKDAAAEELEPIAATVQAIAAFEVEAGPQFLEARKEMLQRVRYGLSLSRVTGDYRFLLEENVLPEKLYATILVGHRGYDNYLKTVRISPKEIDRKNDSTQLKRTEQAVQQNVAGLADVASKQNDIGLHALRAMSDLDSVWIAKVAAPRHGIQVKNGEQLIAQFDPSASNSPERQALTLGLMSDAALQLTAIAQSRAMLVVGPNGRKFPSVKFVVSEDPSQIELLAAWKDYAFKLSTAAKRHPAVAELLPIVTTAEAIAAYEIDPVIDIICRARAIAPRLGSTSRYPVYIDLFDAVRESTPHATEHLFRLIDENPSGFIEQLEKESEGGKISPQLMRQFAVASALGCAEMIKDMYQAEERKADLPEQFSAVCQLVAQSRSVLETILFLDEILTTAGGNVDDGERMRSVLKLKDKLSTLMRTEYPHLDHLRDIEFTKAQPWGAAALQGLKHGAELGNAYFGEKREDAVEKCRTLNGILNRTSLLAIASKEHNSRFFGETVSRVATRPGFLSILNLAAAVSADVLSERGKGGVEDDFEKIPVNAARLSVSKAANTAVTNLMTISGIPIRTQLLTRKDWIDGDKKLSWWKDGSQVKLKEED